MPSISRFYCHNRLFVTAGISCDEQCKECKPEEKPAKVNEGKDSMWFVWERTTRGTGLFYQPARYRGMPQTGTGQAADDARFLFKIELKGDDEKLELIELINKYPCPPKPV